MFKVAPYIELDERNPIDWDNPLTSCLAGCWLLGREIPPPINLVNGLRSTLNFGVGQNLTGSVRGRHNLFNSTPSDQSYNIEGTKSFPDYTGYRGATYAAVLSVPSYGFQTVIGSRSVNHLALYTGSYYYGDSTFTFTYAGTGWTGDQRQAYTYNKLVLIGGSYDHITTTTRLWSDLGYQEIVANRGTMGYPSHHRIGQDDYGFNLNNGVELYAVWAWYRPLTIPDFAELDRDYTQMFRKLSTRAIFPALSSSSSRLLSTRRKVMS